jgi:perosamine synthetase
VNPEPPGGRNGAWCTALVIGKSWGIDKEEMMKELESRGFEARPFFYPLSSMPAYGGESAEKQEKNPVAYDVSRRGINLPAAFATTDDQLSAYCDAVCDVLERHAGKAT